MGCRIDGRCASMGCRIDIDVDRSIDRSIDGATREAPPPTTTARR
jgi:hypothetical protein